MRRFSALLLMISVISPVDAWPWVDEVVSYNPGPGQFQGVFRDPSRMLGRPYGISVSEADNQSVITLGDGGNVTVRFLTPIHNDSRNPQGLDFIVFSNSIWSGGDKTRRWQEAAFVEVSQDGANWSLILPNILPANLIVPPMANPDIGMSRTILRGYAEYSPTMGLPDTVRPEEFYTVPDGPSYASNPNSLSIDNGSGGGDAFDIGWAVRETSPGVPETDNNGQPILANLAWISYVRLTDARVGDTLGSLGEVSAEIDAVATVMPAVQRLGASLLESDQAIVRVEDAVVVRTFGVDSAFVHSADQSCGTVISGVSGVQPGQKLKVVGKLHHSAAGASIQALFFDVLSSGPVPHPITVSVASLVSRQHLSPAGMVAKTWGRVKHTDVPEEFVLEDANGQSVRVMTPFGRPGEGSLAKVTGGTINGVSETTLLVQAPSDITIATP